MHVPQKKTWTLGRKISKFYDNKSSHNSFQLNIFYLFLFQCLANFFMFSSVHTLQTIFLSYLYFWICFSRVLFGKKYLSIYLPLYFYSFIQSFNNFRYLFTFHTSPRDWYVRLSPLPRDWHVRLFSFRLFIVRERPISFFFSIVEKKLFR